MRVRGFQDSEITALPKRVLSALRYGPARTTAIGITKITTCFPVPDLTRGFPPCLEHCICNDHCIRKLTVALRVVAGSVIVGAAHPAGFAADARVCEDVEVERAQRGYDITSAIKLRTPRRYGESQHLRSHCVSSKDASSLGEFVVPVGHGWQAWSRTYSLKEHKTVTYTIV